VLKELLDIRQRLKSLHSRVTSSDEVSDFLTQILKNEGRRKEVADVLGISGDGGAGGGEGGGGGDKEKPA
jgi:predicted component of type VI protein secretion system